MFALHGWDVVETTSFSGHGAQPRWLADVLTQALVREIPPWELYEWLRRCTETLRLRVLVFGRDDLKTIRPNAPTYITQRVRASLGSTDVPGRILPAARTIRSESARIYCISSAKHFTGTTDA
jgi:hypothetical protein